MGAILRSVVLCLTVYCALAAAQDSFTVSPDLSKSPLNVSVDPAGKADLASCGSEGSRNPLVLQFRYEGTKSLRGYLVALSFPNPKGGTAPLHEIETDLIFPNKKLIEPGAQWTRTICTIPDGVNPTDVSTRVDLLGFEDGSNWGPRELRSTSYEFLGMCEGIDYLQGRTDVAKQFAPVAVKTNVTAEEMSDATFIGPLKLTPILEHINSGQASGDDHVVVQVTNVSGSLVRGYDFRISFFDHATGSFLKSVSTQTLEMSQDLSAYLAPGQTWEAGPRKVPLIKRGIA
jgi:hypothetical protein